MRAIFVHSLLGTASQEDDVHKPQLLERKESRSGESNRGRPLTSVKPYRLARPAHGFPFKHALADFELPLRQCWKLVRVLA